MRNTIHGSRDTVDLSTKFPNSMVDQRPCSAEYKWIERVRSLRATMLQPHHVQHLFAFTWSGIAHNFTELANPRMCLASLLLQLPPSTRCMCSESHGVYEAQVCAQDKSYVCHKFTTARSLLSPADMRKCNPYDSPLKKRKENDVCFASKPFLHIFQ